MAEKAKRPQAATRRTLPPDPKSLEQLFHALTRELKGRAEHLKKEPHDYRARRGLQSLFEQRAECFARLAETVPHVTMRLIAEYDLITQDPS